MAITLSDFRECWYVPGQTHIVDMIHPITGLTLHFKKSAEDVLAEHPTAQRMNYEDACRLANAAIDEAHIQPVEETTEARFFEMLEVLPPLKWRDAKGVESFMLSEMTCADITAIFARCGKRYFTLTDRVSLSAEEIADRVHAFISEGV